MEGVDETRLCAFIEKQLKLLGDEHEEEVHEFDSSLKSKSIAALEKEGLALRHLQLLSISKVHGKSEVEFTRTQNSVMQTVFCPGDTVSVSKMSSDATEKEFVGCGILISINEQCVIVSMDEKYSYNIQEIQEDNLCFISKTASYITYKRMKSALQKIRSLEYTPSFHLVQLLFGNGVLRTVPLNPLCVDSKGKLKYINGNLHEVQKACVEFTLRQKNLAIIHGPPGTGKTTTLVEIILQMIKTGNKILACAPSNIAVDTIVEKLLPYKTNVVRVGHTARMLSGVKDYSLDAALTSGSNFEVMRDIKKEMQDCEKELQNSGCVNKRAYKNMLRDLKRELRAKQGSAQRAVLLGSSVVVTTLVTAFQDGPLKDIPCDHFDAVIIDECSQALEAACWIAIPRASKLILAGDHLQLPPTVRSKSAIDGNLGYTLMERAIDIFGFKCYTLLTHQYRMHKDIMSWVSTLYGGKLTADTSVEAHLLKDLPGVSTTAETSTPLLFIDTASCDINEVETDDTVSKVNEGEADIVVSLVNQLLKAKVPPSVISIITPYSLQVSCLRRKLTDHPSIEIKTVDGFQGREKEAVILSFVRSNNRGELGFVTDKRRLNVAVSRARRFLGIVADSETVGRDRNIKSLLDHIDKFGDVYSAVSYPDDLRDSVGNPDVWESVPISRKVGKSKVNVKTISSLKTANISLKEKSCFQQKESGNGRDVVRDAKLNIENDGHELKNKFERMTITDSSCNNTKDVELKVNPCQEANVEVFNAGKRCDVSGLEKFGSWDSMPCAGKPTQQPQALSTGFTFSGTMGGCRKKVETNVSALENGNFSKCNLQEQRIPSRIPSDLKSRKSDKIFKNQDAVLKEFEATHQDDFDTIIQDFEKTHSVCNFSGCKTKVHLMGQQCEFCVGYFCFRHSLPEVHGCGEEARRKARQTFKHPPRVQMNARQKELAATKLKKKVSIMADKRKPEKK